MPAAPQDAPEQPEPRDSPGRPSEQALPRLIGDLLRAHPSQPKLALAESCTGGLICKLITDVPGSSDYFTHGLITYANSSKTQLLGVPAELLEQHGAVSEPVAEVMARGALRGQPGLALSVTGIAGPGGGSQDKPVGTVCISLCDATGHEPVQATRSFLFSGDRDAIRRHSALAALQMLRAHLEGNSQAELPG